MSRGSQVGGPGPGAQSEAQLSLDLVALRVSCRPPSPKQLSMPVEKVEGLRVQGRRQAEPLPGQDLVGPRSLRDVGLADLDGPGLFVTLKDMDLSSLRTQEGDRHPRRFSRRAKALSPTRRIRSQPNLAGRLLRNESERLTPGHGGVTVLAAHQSKEGSE